MNPSSSILNIYMVKKQEGTRRYSNGTVIRHHYSSGIT